MTLYEGKYIDLSDLVIFCQAQVQVQVQAQVKVRSQVRSKKSKDKGQRPGPGLTLNLVCHHHSPTHSPTTKLFLGSK